MSHCPRLWGHCDKIKSGSKAVFITEKYDVYIAEGFELMSIAQDSTLHYFVCYSSDEVQYLLMMKIALGENLDFVTLTTLSWAQSHIRAGVIFATESFDRLMRRRATDALTGSLQECVCRICRITGLCNSRFLLKKNLFTPNFRIATESCGLRKRCVVSIEEPLPVVGGEGGGGGETGEARQESELNWQLAEREPSKAQRKQQSTS